MPQSFIAELVVTHPDLPLTPTIRSVSETTVSVESQPLTDVERSETTVFYSVTSTDFQAFESALAEDHTASDWRVTLEFTECRIYQIHISSDAKFTTPEIATLGVRVLSIENDDRGWRFRLQASDKERLGAYWEYCRDEDVDFHLEKLYSTGPRATAGETDRFEAHLTDRQREVARTVTRMGYFESDGASAEDVAAELGISPSTLSTHLRRIMAKVFRHTFDD
ncbi:helix-turn-helix domain-containing protein [Halobacteria archaeon AArc-m2/3/4]|uniref:Helix-turn-helix domain-containing protein n=1 Tax=Natronoglomus mannanivorans TaxID=2979990 RepID=A0AAP2YVV5_9EURY|nr:helix-turn-helix domain-containing protein [Halobacteria archaeon AArc-xg1-1]MCU4971409.1 helix-turn-helix domain-containing protein [Halobacteria archaeon AArc-m2/3/4]